MLKTKRDEVIHLFFIGLISGRFLGLASSVMLMTYRFNLTALERSSSDTHLTGVPRS